MLTLHSESVADVKDILAANAIALQTMVRRTKTIRKGYAESTISGVETSFKFDDEVIDSAAYRRAFRDFTSDKQLPTRSRPNRDSMLPEGGTIMDSRSETLVQTVSEEPIKRKAVASTSRTVSDTVIDRPAAIVPQPAPPIAPRKRDPQLDSLLHTAVENGNRQLVMTFLDKGADVNSVHGPLGYRPLHVACRHNHPEIATLLLDIQGTDMYATCDSGDTALHVAAVRDLRSVILLRTRGFNLDTPGEHGYTALHLVGSTSLRDKASNEKSLAND